MAFQEFLDVTSDSTVLDGVEGELSEGEYTVFTDVLEAAVVLEASLTVRTLGSYAVFTDPDVAAAGIEAGPSGGHVVHLFDVVDGKVVGLVDEGGDVGHGDFLCFDHIKIVS